MKETNYVERITSLLLAACNLRSQTNARIRVARRISSSSDLDRLRCRRNELNRIISHIDNHLTEECTLDDYVGVESRLKKAISD